MLSLVNGSCFSYLPTPDLAVDIHGCFILSDNGLNVFHETSNYQFMWALFNGVVMKDL